MDASFTYSALPLGNIRVLTLKRICGEAFYELQNTSLDQDRLRFRAISYAWGSPELTQSISCNGQRLLVTSSVFELLLSTVILNLCDELPIWVDAICINQRDDAEKADQVSKMSAVYSLAEEVILWLGPASFDSDLAMDTIRAVSEKKALISEENLIRFSLDEGMVRKAGLANTSEETRCALGSLFDREWFQRLWVFQEVVLARKRQVLCGSKAITWESFADATIAIFRLQYHQFSITFPDVIRGLRAVEGVHHVKRVIDFKRLDGHEFRSVYLLDICQRRAVTDPRDRVYGMLAMTTSDLREKIKVDYSQRGPHASYGTYIECGKACIEEDTSLALLYMLCGAEKNPKLPSWCPDFNNAAHSRNFRLHPKWKAGIRTTPAEEGEPAAWFEPGCDDLYAPGCRVDIVCQVVSSTFCWSSEERDGESPSMEDSVSNLAWQRECLLLSSHTSMLQGEGSMSYLLTLSEGVISSSLYEEDPLIIRAAYKRNISLWRAAARSLPLEDIDQRLRSATHYFHGCLMHTCKGQKFFSTTGGRFGVGPPETQAGDSVYILYGAGPLYLLRFTDEATRVLGNVYIHELMNLDDTPEEVKEENEIVVIN